jgi:hypothetical protein
MHIFHGEHDYFRPLTLGSSIGAKTRVLGPY